MRVDRLFRDRTVNEAKYPFGQVEGLAGRRQGFQVDVQRAIVACGGHPQIENGAARELRVLLHRFGDVSQSLCGIVTVVHVQTAELSDPA